MAKEFSKKFYNSKSWKKCRQAYIQSVLGLCEMCKEPGYIVHHKTELSPDNIHNAEITLGADNLQYLCHSCHNKVHGIAAKQEPTRRVLFDWQGNVIGVQDYRQDG
jgi:5-methylcytosine-specific restriction endonuclease McrA